MKPPSHDPLDLLAQARSKPVSSALMARLRQADPTAAAEVIPPPVATRSPWSHRLLWPGLVAAAACIAVTVVSMKFPTSDDSATVVTATPQAESPAVSVTSSRQWLSARELATGVGEDGQPYRVVEGRWLDCSRITIEGKPDAWTAVTPGGGIVRTAMPVY